MASMLWILFWVLAVLLVVAIAMLLTPVKLICTLHTSPRWQLTVTARPFAGLSPPLPVHDSLRRNRKKAKEPGAKSRKSPRRASPPARRMIRAAPQLVQGLLRSIHFERFKLDADIGLNDPADTGHIYGLLSSVANAIPPTTAASISIRPEFAAVGFEGEARAVVRFTPVSLLSPAAWFAWQAFGPQR